MPGVLVYPFAFSVEISYTTIVTNYRCRNGFEIDLRCMAVDQFQVGNAGPTQNLIEDSLCYFAIERLRPKEGEMILFER